MSFKEFKSEYKKLQNDEEKRNFINKRIQSLISNDSYKRIGLGLTGSYKEFITPNMGIASNSSGLFADLKLDDLGVFEEFMNYFNNDIDNYLSTEPMAIQVIQYFIWHYFGYNSANMFARADVYDRNEPVSVKDLKFKNIAACSERSAMVQNLLKFLGFDSELVFGKLNKESHAYIIFKPEGLNFYILYDPMNAVEYVVDNKKGYMPGVSMMSEEQYRELQNGGTYIFNYDLVKKLFIKDNPYTFDERLYTSDDIKYKKDIEEKNEFKR